MVPFPTMKANKRLILLTCGLFIMSAAMSFFLPQTNHNQGQTLANLDNISEDPSFDSILTNNFQTIGLTIFTGPMTIGASTLMAVSFNGAAQGALAGEAVSKGLVKIYLLLVLPHAILEFPALWLAGAAGFKIPYELTRYLIGRKEYVLNRREMKDYVYLSLASVVLIIIAAWVEANVTMRIAESMM